MRTAELALREREVLLGLTIIFALMSVITTILGVHWTVPTSSSLGSGLSAFAARLGR